MAFHVATARCPGSMRIARTAGLRELRGERLRRGETDAHAAADGGHGYDLDVEVVARRARVDVPRGASAMSHG